MLDLPLQTALIGAVALVGSALGTAIVQHKLLNRNRILESKMRVYAALLSKLREVERINSSNPLNQDEANVHVRMMLESLRNQGLKLDEEKFVQGLGGKAISFLEAPSLTEEKKKLLLNETYAVIAEAELLSSSQLQILLEEVANVLNTPAYRLNWDEMKKWENPLTHIDFFELLFQSGEKIKTFRHKIVDAQRKELKIPQSKNSAIINTIS